MRLKSEANLETEGRPVLTLNNLRTYLYTSKGVVRAVDGVSFEIPAGEILGLVGESGSGKTMTGLSIMRLLPSPPARIADGNILFEGKDLAQIPEAEMRKLRGRRVSMVFQDPLTALNPLMRVGEQVAEVIRTHSTQTKEQAADNAVEILKMVGIPEPATLYMQYPFELSGGMRQRVVIAMAIAVRPRLLIADEPTTNLDATIQAQVLSLLRKIREEQGTSIMLITHNLGIVAWVCDRVAVIYAGKIVELGSTYNVLKNPAHPYTQALLRAVPRLDSERGELESIPGEVPAQPLPVSDECRFNTRCPFAKSICKDQEPPMIQIGENHWASCFIYSKDWEKLA